MKKVIIFINTLIFSFLLSAQTPRTCDITVGTNGVVRTHADAEVGIFGNLENNGSFSDTDGMSEVGFYNNAVSLEISGTTPPLFANLIVDVPEDLQLNVKSEVTTGLLFLNGRIITPRANPDTSLDMVNTDVVANVTNVTHVDGYTSYTGVTAYTFPVGDDIRFRPIAVEAGASLNTTRAAYYFENPSNSQSFPLNLNTEDTGDQVFNVSPFEFWDLDGTSTTRATLTWDIMSNLSQILSSENLNELIITGWNIEEQRWVNLGNFSVTGNLSEGSITSNPFNPNDYEALTFATNTFVDNGNQPIDLIVFNGITAQNKDGVNDFLGIQNIRQFPKNTLKIFNRWGVKVFDVDGYDAEPASSENFTEPTNAFIGRSRGRITVKKDDLLPVGTYFYVLTYIVDIQGGEKTQSGYLYINR